MTKITIAAAVLVAGALAVAGYAQVRLPTAVPHGFMIANYDINDQSGFKRYMDAAGPLAPRFGGKVTVFNMKTTGVEGRPRSVIAIAEFPTLVAAKRFYYSPEYTAARRYRIASTTGSVILTEGTPPSP